MNLLPFSLLFEFILCRSFPFLVFPAQKSSFSISCKAGLMMLNPLNFCLSGKFLNRSEYQTTLPVSWETCVQVKKHKLEPEKEEQTGSKLEKEYNKAVYCHLAYLTYRWSTSHGMTGWVNHKLESRFPRETSTTSDLQMIPL